MLNNITVGCVIVTFNRLVKLKKTLMAYEKQIVKPAYIIVIDNASTDGTSDFLQEWQKESITTYNRYVVSLKKNLGGSGGFFVGQEIAVKLSAQWIMLSDDDAYPEPNYISGLQDYIIRHENDNLSIVCGIVEQHNSVNNEHRVVWDHKYKWKFYKKISINELSKNDGIEIGMTSYVGPVINKLKLLEVGLVNKDYFIWQDDFEHSIRLGKVGKIVCVPILKIVHDADEAHIDFSWKTYYAWRNGVNLRKLHLPYILFLIALLNGIGRIMLSPLRGHCIREIIVRIEGIKDGLKGKLGLHPIYKPGWKP